MLVLVRVLFSWNKLKKCSYFYTKQERKYNHTWSGYTFLNANKSVTFGPFFFLQTAFFYARQFRVIRRDESTSLYFKKKKKKRESKTYKHTSIYMIYYLMFIYLFSPAIRYDYVNNHLSLRQLSYKKKTGDGVRFNQISSVFCFQSCSKIQFVCPICFF